MFLVAALALTGCGAAETGSAGDSKAAAPDARSANDAGAGAERAAPGAAGSDGSNGSKAAPPKVTANSIIRTASLIVVVKEVPKALDDARATAENAGGYVGDETTTRDGRGHELTRVVLRVPSERYDQVLADLEGAGKVVERTAKAQDVTDQVVDVESRVKTQRASVARVRELMDRATRLSDVVSLEGELSSRESDLEALLAQQASLKDRTSLATITLSLSETPVKKAEKKDADPGFLDALSGGWNVLVTVVRWLALAIGAVLPFAAALALIALVWFRGVSPRLRRSPAPAVASGPAPAVASGASGGPAASPSAAPVPASRPASDPASDPASGPASRSTATPKAAPPARGTSSEGGEED
ncbi:DUF4349 domain-containing protein [Streptomyces rhizosphaerihabitans]|uniref:DUF4349 domain-containing protein n=1 Tax=Streptomyces rhizosphaerihabitans TaxID=1266770 RepID=UPI0021BF0139|nr:DUF4349 domain-containing protein [Streptomyces rhizosphaerihabitans]MCT9006011.1 DUF4349 domain-containing protein [Streptomyces rhizosphaerihabitans]